MYDEVIKYLGCIGVKTSMRSLEHRERTEVAVECIKRLCNINEIQDVTDNHTTMQNGGYDRMLEERPNLKYSGMDVKLCVTSTHLNVLSMETNLPLVQHAMPNVSFASYGDEETKDYIAYVAKDDEFGRACFVFKCTHNTAKPVIENIARGFRERIQKIYSANNFQKTSPGYEQTGTASLFNASNSYHKTPNEMTHKISDENALKESLITATREYLKKESWFHGSYLSREQSETRLKQDGDFLVRESMLDPGTFVLSVMHDGTKLHLVFDSVEKVKTREREFDDISHLVRYHHENALPIVAIDSSVYLLNGVRPSHKSNSVP